MRSLTGLSMYLVCGGLLAIHQPILAQTKVPGQTQPPKAIGRADTTRGANGAQTPSSSGTYLNLWGLDIMVSNGGFGLGGQYRREFTPALAGQITFSVSEAKDDQEVEFFDPYSGTSYKPGKLNRFMILPLMAGVQYRLFRDDIVDTFRPYINASVGPAMIYQMPYAENVAPPGEKPLYQEVEFFTSIGKGHPEYTFGGFIGAGAYFGSEKSSVFGINVRYYFIYMLNGGLPSLFNPATGEVTSYKTDFGGFYITLNIGTAN